MFLSMILAACSGASSAVVVSDVKVEATLPAVDCAAAKNTCPDYAPSWVTACPAGERCLTFTNASPTETVALSYQIGCNGDGTKGAPQCDCTNGPVLAPGVSSYFVIVNGDYTSCLPSWTPACLTAGLAVIANATTASCAAGTRVEFSAGNAGDPYGKFDSYDIDIEPTKGGGQFYSIPVAYAPNLVCADDYANHDCRPLGCTSETCPDAYSTPTGGTCPDGRSPQVGCQDTFNKNVGYTVTYYPTTSASCGGAIPCNAATPAPAPK
jgi:mRNA-degrading endonuclease toxin of MazEF toxin-antitoxin module